MKLADLVYAPWAIKPQMYQEVLGIFDRHVRGDKIDLQALEAKLGRPLDNQPKEYSVQDGVAVIPIDGVLSKRMSLLGRISGGTSTTKVGEMVSQALEDPAVDSILLHIDSPGGAVDGTQELAQLIFEGRAQKPIVALADGCACSAAYWIASAAEQVFITSDTTEVGSIGVVATHRDYSQQEAAFGVKTTEITAGKYKRVASAYAPLTDEGRATIQGQVDHIYSVFVDAVAAHRGTDAETVLQNMADGRVFLGRQAVEAGLVDGVSTLDALLAGMARGEIPGRPSMQRRAEAVSSRAGAGAPEQSLSNHQEESMKITRDLLEAENPDLLKQIQAEGRAEGEAETAKAVADARAAGATAERERIQAVLEQSMPGHEALVQGLAFDGKTTGPEAAVKVLAAEKAAMADKGKAIRSDAPKPAPASEPGSTSTEGLPVEERAKLAWDKDPNLRAEFGGSFEAYLGFERAVENGTVRIKKS